MKRYPAREDALEYHWKTMFDNGKGNHWYTQRVPSYIYFAKMSAKSFLLPKHMIVASAPTATMCNLPTQSDEPVRKTEAQLWNTAHSVVGRGTNIIILPVKSKRLRPCQVGNIDNAVQSVHYDQPETMDDQMDKLPNRRTKQQGIQQLAHWRTDVR